MTQQEIIDFAEYRVFHEDYTLCLCKDIDDAVAIAKCLAIQSTKPNVKFSVTFIDKGGPYFVIGGGWVKEYWRDENNVLHSGGYE